MAKKVFSLEEYSQSVYESGYYAGIMFLGLPIYHILEKYCEDGMPEDKVFAVMTQVITVLRKKTEGVIVKSEELQEILKKYDFNVEGKLFTVDVEDNK